MEPKRNKNYIAGIYLRLSRDDERAGESLSIENQKILVTKYVKEKGWEIKDVYVDDGYSGTNFDRPGVKRLLDDAKEGEINTIVVKDLSRFGRNYILVGQYIDYVFPSFGIRFIAIEDRIDTASKDTSAMDMMPIMNVFNEWHSANTSKKIRAVKYSCAQAGKYLASKAPYGYVRKDDKNHTPIIDEEAAQVVRRIFERRGKGESAYRIALDLQADGISSPAVYAERKFGKKVTGEGHNFWSPAAVRGILAQQLYVGDLVQQRVKHISYKNKKVVKVPKEEQVIIPNNHEPIISRELWNKVKELEATASTGKITKERVTPALSGIMRCSTCGATMEYHKTVGGRRKKHLVTYECGLRNRYGADKCTKHYINGDVIHKIILDDIRAKAKIVAEDEEGIRKRFIRRNAMLAEQSDKETAKAIKMKRARIAALDDLMSKAYEDKLLGKMPEELCMKFIDRYLAEQENLRKEVSGFEAELRNAKDMRENIDEFMSRIKKYLDVTVITREMMLELFDKIIIGEKEPPNGAPRLIQLVYKVDIDSVL